MRREGSDREGRDRVQVAGVLTWGEFVLDAAVAFALAGGGTVLLVAVIYDFVRHLGREPAVEQALTLLSGLLLVFIFTELISTLRVIIARRRIEVEPFLIVGIVAAIRRLIVIGAEAEALIGTDHFADVMLEIGILTGTVLVLGVTILILRLVRERGGDPAPTAPGPLGDGAP